MMQVFFDYFDLIDKIIALPMFLRVALGLGGINT